MTDMRSDEVTSMAARSRVARGAALLMALAVAACAAAAREPVTLPVRGVDGTDITGTVRLVSVGPRMTRVEVRVQAPHHPDMPAHIHPGTCADAIPQPKYPLENVRDGRSDTEVPASLTELRTELDTLNLHASNDDMQNVVACTDLTEAAAAP
jgi:hypothetical protein